MVESQQLGMELDTFRVRGARYHQCSTSQIQFTILTNTFAIWANTVWRPSVHSLKTAVTTKVYEWLLLSDHSNREIYVLRIYAVIHFVWRVNDDIFARAGQ